MDHQLSGIPKQNDRPDRVLERDRKMGGTHTHTDTDTESYLS